MGNDIIDKHELQRLRDIEKVLNEASIVAFTDKQGRITHANDKFCEISKYNREELIGSYQSLVNSGHHSREFFKDLWRTIGTGNIWHGEIKNKAKDGTFYWVDTTILPFIGENGKPYQYASVRHDITKIKEQKEIIKQMAYYDHLTFLPNRHWLDKWLQEQTDDIIQHLAVLFLDLDLFKSINDSFGHYTGDLILKEVATRLEKCIGPNDFIIRQGGDEFIIFLTNTKSDKDAILSVVQDIQQQFLLPFFVQNKQTFINVSIGVSMNVNKIIDNNYLKVMEETISEADTAMYHAKKIYGNTYLFNTEDQNVEIGRYYEIIAELKDALSNNEFFIVYQPIMSVKEQRIVGVEALLRWNNPQLGLIPPDEFIPHLEELGLINYVGTWILQSVCKQMKQWIDEGILVGRAAVNVSPLQFNDDHFVQDVQHILETTGLEPKYLELEITESIIMDIEKSEKTLQKLKDLGVTISIDDFGTGYSSLSYLRQLPIHTLKIDKSFIDSLDQDGQVIVNTIITMGTNLNYKILAEGIETNEQLHYLSKQDCEEGQGYYWSKPVDPEAIKQFYLKQHNN